MVTAKQTDGTNGDKNGWLYRVSVGLLFALALAPRCSYYLTGRALWFDEAALCVNVLDRGFGDLLAPLAFKQVAPPLYLWSLKLCSILGGASVYAVRFPSLIAGLLSLVLFWYAARRLLRPEGALAGLLMVALSQHLINYAGEAKPYAADVALAIAVLCLALRWEERPSSWWRAFRYGAVPAVFVWYSYPVVFVVAGVGLSQLAFAAGRRNWDGFGKLVVLYGISALSFLVLFFVAILPSRGDSETMAFMDNYWRHGFMPFPPTELWDLRWYRERAFMFFDMPGGFTLQGVALFVWLTGVVSWVYRKPEHAIWVVLPLVLTLLASSQRIYPFHGRMTLFLVPVIFLGIGEGVDALGRDRNRATRGAIVAVLLLLLMTQPAVRALRMVVAPSRHHELEKVLEYADRHWQSGDQLYLREGDHISYRFIASRYSFPANSVHFEVREGTVGRTEELFRSELASEFGMWGRVWFPMAYDDESAIGSYVTFLDQHGTRFDRFVARGATVYGLDFSVEPAPSATE